jgi:hypothetical protein
LQPPAAEEKAANTEKEGMARERENKEETDLEQERLDGVLRRAPSLSKSRSSPDLVLDTSFLPKLKHQPLVPPPR